MPAAADYAGILSERKHVRFREGTGGPEDLSKSKSSRRAKASRDKGDELLEVVDDGEVFKVRLQRIDTSIKREATGGLGRQGEWAKQKEETDHPSSKKQDPQMKLEKHNYNEELDTWLFDIIENDKQFMDKHPKAGDHGSKSGELSSYLMNISSNRRTKAETDKARLLKAHRRFGHYNFRKSAAIIGMSAPVAEDQPFCRVCAAAKLHREDKSTVKLESKVSTRVGEYLHIDGSGIIRFKTINGNKYFVPVVDDYSGRTFVLLLAKKNHFLEGIRKLISSIEASTGKPVVRMKLDGDGAFRGLELQRFCDERDNVITLQGPPPYTSHKNGKAERAVGVIKEMARCMLIESGLARRYWGEAVKYAVHVLNRLPRASTPEGYNCPLSAWKGSNISLLMFGLPVLNPQTKSNMYQQIFKSQVLLKPVTLYFFVSVITRTPTLITVLLMSSV